jgi:hypothetical protein
VLAVLNLVEMPLVIGDTSVGDAYDQHEAVIRLDNLADESIVADSQFPEAFMLPL